MRSTEVAFLNALSKGQITPQAERELLMKVGKGQKKSRARDITDATEDEYHEILAMIQSLSDVLAKEVKTAITDYTQDSTEINKYLRGLPDHQDKSATVARIDKMFSIYDLLGFSSTTRITYRLASYKTGQVVPYGAAASTEPKPKYAPINIGDYVTDKAYVSASENRRLLVDGIKNAARDTVYVKCVIVGSRGINISGGSLYNNANELAMHNMTAPNESLYKRIKRRLMTPNAGQAEILFPRGTVFQVDDFTRKGNDYHLKLSVPNPQPTVGLKNMFSGLPA